MSVATAILVRMSVNRVPHSARFAGIVTAGELGRAGWSPAQIRTLTRRGELEALGRGVYVAAPHASAARDQGVSGEHALQVAAVLATAVPGSVASHRSAAIIHGLDLLGTPSRLPVDMTKPPGAGSNSSKRQTSVHAAALPPQHLTVRAGIPLTTVARTVVDLARLMPFRAGVVAADSALRGRQATRQEFQAVIGDCRRWRGIQRARRVVEFSDERSESALESISRVVFAEHGLPTPELQVWVGDHEGAIGRADFLWEAYRTIGEADGLGKYSDPSRALAQLQRDARLREAGFEVVHFTWQEVNYSPGRVVASVRAAFQRAAAR
jgi:predicted transcriptional regulator of viral defense system